LNKNQKRKRLRKAEAIVSIRAILEASAEKMKKEWRDEFQIKQRMPRFVSLSAMLTTVFVVFSFQAFVGQVNLF
jgi:hypothetical protein